MTRGGPLQPKKKADVRGYKTNGVVKLGPDIKARIGQQLRLMYSEVVDQGVPDRFVEMLKRLDDPTNRGSKQ